MHMLELRFFEKATQFEKIYSLGFGIYSVSSKPSEIFFFQILWPNKNILTLLFRQRTILLFRWQYPEGHDKHIS